MFPPGLRNWQSSTRVFAVFHPSSSRQGLPAETPSGYAIDPGPTKSPIDFNLAGSGLFRGFPKIAKSSNVDAFPSDPTVAQAPGTRPARAIAKGIGFAMNAVSGSQGTTVVGDGADPAMRETNSADTSDDGRESKASDTNNNVSGVSPPAGSGKSDFKAARFGPRAVGEVGSGRGQSQIWSDSVTETSASSDISSAVAPGSRVSPSQSPTGIATHLVQLLGAGKTYQPEGWQRAL